MAFLDNSGDIILDAVLTDTGRYRLAKGDGSFRVVKFALGDDEINYKLYDKNNPSGSAYYDLSILQTPILEAFTDNAASLKSKLISISRTNLLFLPVVKLNETSTNNQRSSAGTFYVACDTDTTDKLVDGSGRTLQGVIKGTGIVGGTSIRLDQGLDSNYTIEPTITIDGDLLETQYILEIDSRLGQISNKATSTAAAVSYVDDDGIASTFLSLGTDTEYITENTDTSTGTGQVITGPRGSTLQFRIKSSANLQQSDYLFDQLGSTVTINSVSYKFIDSTVRVMGATTGYRVDIPVRFLKLND